MRLRFFDIEKYIKWVDQTPEAQSIFTEEFMNSIAVQYKYESLEWWTAIQIHWIAEGLYNKTNYLHNQQAKEILNNTLKKEFGENFMGVPTIDTILKFVFIGNAKAKKITYKLFVTDDGVTFTKSNKEIKFPLKGLVHDFREFACYIGHDVVILNVKDYRLLNPPILKATEFENELQSIVHEIHNKIIPIKEGVELIISVNFGNHFDLYNQNLESLLNQNLERNV